MILNQLLQISLRNTQGYQNILLRERKQWNPTLQSKGAIAMWVTFDEPKGIMLSEREHAQKVTLQCSCFCDHLEKTKLWWWRWWLPELRLGEVWWWMHSTRLESAPPLRVFSQRTKARIHVRQLTAVRAKGHANSPNSKAVRYPEMDSIWTMEDFWQFNKSQRSSGTCEAGPPPSTLLTCSYLGKLSCKRNRYSVQGHHERIRKGRLSDSLWTAFMV